MVGDVAGVVSDSGVEVLHGVSTHDMDSSVSRFGT